MTYSVDYNEPIIIKENGEIKVVKIGELIDKIIENSENIRREGILEIAKCKGIEVIAFNSNYKFKFMPVSEVSRHPVSEMFEIVVEGNKKVRVTRSHSVFTIRDNEVVPIRVDELKVGDILVLAKELPNIEEDIEIDKKFSKILGYIIAEGYYDDKKIVLSYDYNEKEFINETIDYFKSLNSDITIYSKDLNIQIEVKNKKIINLLKKLRVKNKRIPSIIFKSPYEIKKSFIDGIFNGKDAKVFVSKELAEDVIFLLLQIKENATINKRV